MIRVERIEARAEPADADAALRGMEARPGVWLGCDVEAEGLFRKASMACTRPALRFCLDGNVLAVVAMSSAGAGLLKALQPLAGLDGDARARAGLMPDGASVLRLLRECLAAFDTVSPEFAYFGALAFDYARLARPEPLPADGQRRMVLYLPEEVLSVRAGSALRVGFRFGVEAAAFADAAGVGEPRPVAAAIPEPGAHARRVSKGVELLARGELYSLVLSQAFRWPARASPSEAFATLRRRNPYPAMFFCNLGAGEVLFGASPDLQVRADAMHVESAPVCGTLRRGTDAIADDAQAMALLNSPKEAAAIALCADAAVEDAASVCVPGTVDLVSHRRVHFFSTIVHAVDHVRGRREPGCDAFDVLLAHAYPATVTGVPKAAAVQAIERLEDGARGWYAGAVVRIGSDGSLEALTVLRAARVVGGVAEVRVGGNVLVDSDPASEEEETVLKARTLREVLRVVDEGVKGSPARETERPAIRVRVLPSDDPSPSRLRDALAKAGAVPGEGDTVAVLSGVPIGTLPSAPVVAIGEGAHWLMRQAGARQRRLERPEFARPMASRGGAGFLAGVEEFQAALYAREAFDAGGMPTGWRVAASAQDGRVLAAEREDGRAIALLFRPDSILARREDGGLRVLRAALERCDMFAASRGTEGS